MPASIYVYVHVHVHVHVLASQVVSCRIRAYPSPRQIIPFGAGACTLAYAALSGVEYRSAVKVSTLNTTPPPRPQIMSRIVLQTTSLKLQSA
jgi:hypothetical protein